MAKRFRLIFSLRFKFTLLLALFSGLLMVGAMSVLEQDIRQSLVQEAIQKGIGIAQGLAFNVEDPLLTGDDIYLFSAVSTAAKSPGVRYALIVDETGQVKAADDIARVGESFALPAVASREAVAGDYSVMRVPGSASDILDLGVPILTLAEPHLRLGEIHLGLDEEIITQAIASMRQRLAILSGVALAVGSLAAFLLAALFLRPVKALVFGVRAIGEGNLEQRIELRRRDELGVLTDAFNEMASSLREKEYIKNTFERYVSKPLAQQILRHKDQLQLGGEEREVTILFADIRNFTPMAEQLSPPEVVELLNDYFTRMVSIIGHQEGMVDKYMGDAIMTLFGAPIPVGDEPLRAVRCALEMQQELGHFNQQRSEQGLPSLAMGIGINTGPVVAGNIGSQMRMEYTVIGDNVNIASRLQGIAGAGEVLISESTYRQLAGRIQAVALEPMQLKGKSVPVGVYRVTGLA